MDKVNINEIIKAAAGALDLSNFKGDVVMYKHVEKEMNVAENGIGEQHIHHHYAENKSEGDVPLIRFIPNSKDRDTVYKGLLDCKNTGQVAAFLKRIYDEEIMPIEDIRSGDFHSALISLLKFKTTETAIKQAIYKQVK